MTSTSTTGTGTTQLPTWTLQHRDLVELAQRLLQTQNNSDMVTAMLSRTVAPGAR